MRILRQIAGSGLAWGLAGLLAAVALRFGDPVLLPFADTVALRLEPYMNPQDARFGGYMLLFTPLLISLIALAIWLERRLAGPSA